MKKLLKRISVVLIAIVMCCTVFVGVGCNRTEQYDKNKTQLFVANYAGGVGVKWLEAAAKRFEDANTDYKGEGSKVGVQVVIDNQKEYEGQSLATTMAGSSYEIFFTGNAAYHNYKSAAKDITDIVTKTVGSDGKTIESKFYQEDKDFMSIGGKYYGIPHYEIDDGISYDAGVFESKRLYFSDTIDTEDTTYPGTRKFIVNANTKKSPGPNGVYENGAGDDGLPSSIAEFYKLLDKTLTNDVKAFVWTGELVHYTTILAIGLSNNLLGGDGLKTCFTFDSEGKTIDIVTGFDAGGKPIVTPTVITEDNAYLLKQSLANYYALEFCSKVYAIGSGLYDEDCITGTVGNLRAMEIYANSGLNGDMYDAMIIEGSYWHNEATADGIFDRLAEDYPATYTKKNIKYMPLPRQYAGTVTEGNGTAPVFSASGASYCFVNKSVTDKQMELVEKFLSFIYTDDELVKFTESTNGITKRLQYDCMKAYENVNSYGKSLLEVRAEAVNGGGYVIPFSMHRVFLNNSRYFGRNNTSGYWDSVIGGTTYSYVYTATRNNQTAKDYFLGMKMTESQWNTYNK